MRSALQNSLGWLAEILTPSIASEESTETNVGFGSDESGARLAATVQVTGVFEVPVTAFLKDFMPAEGTEVLVELMHSTAAIAVMTATIAKPDFVRSATLVATTPTVGRDTLDGGVKSVPF
jgi:hypothetical protein